MDPVTLLLLAWMFGKRTDKQNNTRAAAAPSPATPARAVVQVGPAENIRPASPPTSLSADALVRRARQQRARDWIPDLVAAGAAPEVAEGLSRWIGIESSGNPLALSPLGERGLLQIMAGTAKDGAITPAEWDALSNPNTSRAEHARIALKQYAWHVKRARLRVTNPPPVDDVPSWLWYAKYQHARPVSLRDAKPHGPALPFSRDLASRWANKPAEQKRIAISNIIATGKA